VRADYGKALIDHLAADLGLGHGQGFSRSNLIRFRQFYLAYPEETLPWDRPGTGWTTPAQRPDHTHGKRLRRERPLPAQALQMTSRSRQGVPT
jgi:hypothetical protein